MKAEVIAGIAISATILLLFLIWLIYYGIKTSSKRGENSENHIQTDGIKPHVEVKALDVPPITQESLQLGGNQTPVLPDVKYEVVSESKARKTFTASTVVLPKSAAEAIAVNSRKRHDRGKTDNIPKDEINLPEASKALEACFTTQEGFKLTEVITETPQPRLTPDLAKVTYSEVVRKSKAKETFTASTATLANSVALEYPPISQEGFKLTEVITETPQPRLTPDLAKVTYSEVVRKTKAKETSTSSTATLANSATLETPPNSQDAYKLSVVHAEPPNPTPDLPKLKYSDVVRKGKAQETSVVSTKAVLPKTNSASVVSTKSVLPNSASIAIVLNIKKQISNLQRIHNDRNDWRGPKKIPLCIAETQSLILIPAYRKHTVELLRAKSDLIISVDARPSIQAGYCVNLKEKWIQYYVVKKEDLHWILRNENDSDEFEMKNLIFALTIWYEEIVRNESFQIFTDNNEVRKCDTKYGRRTQQLLNHFVNCEQVKVKNISNIHINRMIDIEQFALFLKPADDFSRWRITDAVNFLAEMYGIRKESVKGTHSLTRAASGRRRAWYDPTHFYSQILRTAQRQIQLFGSDCLNPSCSKILWASLRGHQTGRNRSLLTQQMYNY